MRLINGYQPLSKRWFENRVFTQSQSTTPTSKVLIIEIFVFCQGRNLVNITNNETNWQVSPDMMQWDFISFFLKFCVLCSYPTSPPFFFYLNLSGGSSQTSPNFKICFGGQNTHTNFLIFYKTADLDSAQSGQSSDVLRVGWTDTWIVGYLDRRMYGSINVDQWLAGWMIN